jgi:hypothetical protein
MGYPFLTWQDYDPVPVEPLFSGGIGTVEDPFQLTSWEDLDGVRGYADAHFVLMNDLDGNSPGYAGTGDTWSPIETFTGSFDGHGYTISNLVSQEGGLFGMADGAVLANVGLVDVDINGVENIGALVGRALNGALIENSFATGTLVASGRSSHGGLVGRTDNVETTIRGSWADVDVTVTREGTDARWTGGLAGYVREGLIEDSYALGNVVSTGENVGGLAGRAGLSTTQGVVRNSYSTGQVSGDRTVGGLLGALGAVEVGSEVIASFWDMESSGLTESPGGTGLSTAEMQDGLTYLDAGWDIVTSANPVAVWGINPDANMGYPFLTWQDYDPVPVEVMFSGGSGTEEDPYQLTSWADLDGVRNFADAYFVLMNDLDGDSPGYAGTGDTWSPIDGFTGTFDGNGHTIDGLTSTIGGLFLQIGGEAIVKNLGVINANISSTTDNAGVLVDAVDDSASVVNSFTTGTLESSGRSSQGGLVGRVNGAGASILGSWSSAEVSATAGNARWTGGLVGYLREGLIEDSYATGNVTTVSVQVAGLVGRAGAGVDLPFAIRNSYSTGQANGVDFVGGLVGRVLADDGVWEVTASFWDMEASGVNSSEAGTGLSTAEMQDGLTYLNAGWDIVTTEDPVAIWGINPDVNMGYPFLTWQGYDPVPVEKPDPDPEFIPITSWTDLHNVRDSLDGYFVLQVDLDEFSEGYMDYNAGGGWVSIEGFTGTFDGNGHTISGLTSTIGGLFLEIRGGAIVQNLGVINANISSSSNNAGILVDWAHQGALIENCFSTGKLVASGRSSHGGLVGRTDNIETTISQSWSSADVTVTYVSTNDARWSGGLAGYIREGLIKDSYATGKVVSTGVRVGGLVGQVGLDNTQGIVMNSYSTGEVDGSGIVGGLMGGIGAQEGGSEVIASFWDTESSGMAESFGGEGLTTAQMKTESTFTDAGWDFTEVWAMDSEIHSGYPHLRNAVHVDDPEPVEITFANVQWPEDGEIKAGEEFTVYARVEAEGVTDNGESALLNAWIGYNEADVAPDASGWTWVEAEFNSGYTGTGHEYMAEIGSGLTAGTYYYVSRFQLINQDYVYGGFDGGFWDGETNVSGVLVVSLPTDAEVADIPVEFGLQQNYPNPFNPVTNINYQVPESAHVTIEVYNVLGQRVTTLVNEIRDAGYHSVQFDGSRLASGVYIYRMDAGDFVKTQKLILAK